MRRKSTALVAVIAVTSCTPTPRFVRIPGPGNPTSVLVRASRGAIEACFFSDRLETIGYGFGHENLIPHEEHGTIYLTSVFGPVSLTRELCIAGTGQAVAYHATYEVHMEDVPGGVRVTLRTTKSYTIVDQGFWSLPARASPGVVLVPPTTVEPYTILRTVAECAGDASLPPPRVPALSAADACAD